MLTYSLNYGKVSLDEGGEPMSINLDRVSDAQIIADRLVGLPKEALLYIAGYAEGYRDRPARKRKCRRRPVLS